MAEILLHNLMNRIIKTSIVPSTADFVYGYVIVGLSLRFEVHALDHVSFTANQVDLAFNDVIGFIRET